MTVTATRVELIHVIWDLRDAAYDAPEVWSRVDAESVFQALAESFQAEEERAGRPDTATWAEFGAVVRLAARQARNYARPAD